NKWSFWGKEVGDNASTFSIASENGIWYAKLEANATQKGSIHLDQATSTVCQTIECRIDFDYRTQGAGQPVLLLGQGGGLIRETSLEPTDTWHHVTAAWKPAADVVPHVYLRANFE